MRLSLFLYWIISIGIIVGANQVVGSSSLYRETAGVVDRLHGRLEDELGSSEHVTLILGNSYVAAALPADALPEGFVRLVEFGAPLENIVQMIEHLPASSSVDRIIVGLGYNYANPTIANAELHNKYFASNAVARTWWSIPLVRGRSLAVTILKNWALCTAGVKKCKGRVRVGLTSANATESTELEDAGVNQATDMTASVQNRLRQYRPLLISVSKAFRSKIARMVAACNERSIELRVFTAPIHPDLRRQLDGGVLEAFGSAVTSSGAAYVDLNGIASAWDDSYFHDATHVSRKGASEVVRRMLDWIEKTK